MLKVVALCFLVSCHGVLAGAAVVLGGCEDPTACDQDTSSLLQIHQNTTASTEPAPEPKPQRGHDAAKLSLLMIPHKGTHGPSTCSGGPNPDGKTCPQYECYGDSSCCCGTGRCKARVNNICRLVNSCTKPPCGTVKDPGFPEAKVALFNAQHTWATNDGCTCPGVEGCDPSSGAICWGQMTCDMKMLSSCKRTGTCQGLFGKVAVVGSFCISYGNVNIFDFCPTVGPVPVPGCRRRRSWQRRRRCHKRGLSLAQADAEVETIGGHEKSQEDEQSQDEFAHLAASGDKIDQDAAAEDQDVVSEAIENVEYALYEQEELREDN